MQGAVIGETSGLELQGLGEMCERGFSLLEIVLVMVIVAIVTAFGVPRLGDALAKQSVRSAGDAIATMHSRARGSAIQRRRRTVLVLKNGGVVIRSVHPITGALDTVGAPQLIGERYGVTVSTARDSLVFDPRGMGTEASTTFIEISKGSSADTLRVTPAGRLLQ
jgi:prepilin-type N-terminal cleavage/methylation domain-containing protein